MAHDFGVARIPAEVDRERDELFAEVVTGEVDHHLHDDRDRVRVREQLADALVAAEVVEEQQDGAPVAPRGEHVDEPRYEGSLVVRH